MVVCTNTFYAPLIACIALTGKRSRIVHLIYDLYPDVLVQAGTIKEQSIIFRIIDSITRATIRRSAVNVFLGKHLLEHAQQRFGDIPNAQIIAVGADGQKFKQYPPKLLSKVKPIRILYCGNMGRMHDTQTMTMLLKGSNWTPARPVQFHFHSNGNGFKLFRREASGFIQRNNLQIFYGSLLSEDDWGKVMLEADVALVSMALGAEDVVMPSKTYSALVAGQAILAICSQNSDLAGLVRKHDCGWVVAPGDVVGLKDAINEICENERLLLERRVNAFKAGHDNYEAKVVSREWLKILK